MAEISNNFNSTKKRPNRLWVGIIIATVIIIAIAGFLFLKYRTNLFPSSLATSIFTVSDSSKAKFAEADKATSVGDYTGAQVILDSVAKDQTDIANRSYVYIQKSILALNDSNIEDAINFANMAETLYPSRLSAVVSAQAAEKANDKQSALKFYKLVIERTTDQEKNLSIDDYNYYESKVKEFSNL